MKAGNRFPGLFLSITAILVCMVLMSCVHRRARTYSAAESMGTELPRVSRHAPEKIYVVKNGDTLGEISLKMTGARSHWRQIARYNRMRNASRLSVGQEIRIPEAWIRHPQVGVANPGPQPAPAPAVAPAPERVPAPAAAPAPAPIPEPQAVTPPEASPEPFAVGGQEDRIGPAPKAPAPN